MGFFEIPSRFAEPLDQRFGAVPRLARRRRFRALCGKHLLNVSHYLLEQFTVARVDAVRRGQLALEFRQFAAQILQFIFHSQQDRTPLPREQVGGKP